MSNYLPLDKAAVQTGKSEVTLRRLLKAGKIDFQKEKTLTGFIYLVDPEKVREYYKQRDGFVVHATDLKEEAVASLAGLEVKESMSNTTNNQEADLASRPVRVAVASESGSPTEYWQKKSELYEDKYNNEVQKHSQTREELGVWRGRAEQAQSMLMKMLPAPTTETVSEKGSGKRRGNDSKWENGSLLLPTMLVVLVLIMVIGGGLLFYMKLLP